MSSSLCFKTRRERKKLKLARTGLLNVNKDNATCLGQNLAI